MGFIAFMIIAVRPLLGKIAARANRQRHVSVNVIVSFHFSIWLFILFVPL